MKKVKGFTLIELIVVMAIIGILVMLAAPRFMNYSKDARLTKLVVESKELEKAAEKYYMVHQGWPRLSDEPYTAEEVTAFADKVLDSTGSVIVLDSEGSYYDIAYDKLSNYIKGPSNGENYILQNPIGSVYSLENLTNVAKVRLPGAKKENEGEIVSIGSQFEFNYTGNVQTFTVPQSGIYKLELWGAQGGYEGGKGGYAFGNIQLDKGEQLYVYVGQEGWKTPTSTNVYEGGWNGGGGVQTNSYGQGGTGGGATDIRMLNGDWYNTNGLNSRIIVAGGGGGRGFSSNGRISVGGLGGGLIGIPGTGGVTKYGITSGGTQTSGGLGDSWNNAASFGQGGGGTGGYGAAGGGGGGWYGGGGGNYEGGGGSGGSSYYGSLQNAGTTAGVNSGHGKAVITYIGK